MTQTKIGFKMVIFENKHKFKLKTHTIDKYVQSAHAMDKVV